MLRRLDPDLVRGTVVIAVDGSDHAERALRWAADQAALEHRRLVVVAVGETAAGALDPAEASARSWHPELIVRSALAAGDPREVLIDASRHAHLLVLGSRGRGAFTSVLLGSVSAAVSAEAACPVVVCRPPDERPTRTGVVVGADGTPESLPVIEFAYRQAYLRGLPLTVLHSFFDAAAAVAQYRVARGLPADGAELDELRAGLAESVAGLAEEYPGVDVTLTLEHGFADQALSPRHDGWDMVVVGRHPLTSLSRVLTGSLATAVVERSHATVAVVPEMEARRPEAAPRHSARVPG
ncbi:universal stress protein [Nocardia sp. N13]|uniref:universal stress protein n=1 Tax=Nocardioides sp. N13(2025) TaxID=3453405 RepID=UPI003F768196